MKLDVWFRKGIHPSYPEEATSLELDKGKLALLVVDMQNMFVHPEGVFASRGVDLSGARKLIEPVKEIARACREIGIPVIYARHTFRPDFCDRSKIYLEVMYLRQGTEEAQARSLVRDSWDSAIVDELTPNSGDIIIDSKHLFSCFYHTDLDLVLRNLGIETILFTGVTTSICVETSIKDAFHRGFRCILVDDCTWEKVPEMETASKTVIAMHFGYLTSSKDVLAALAET